jgi:hypothetical protein
MTKALVVSCYVVRDHCQCGHSERRVLVIKANVVA